MNLNGKPTNPGELRTQIAIESRAITTGPGGAQKPTWSTDAEVWAKWRNAHGNEALTGGSVTAEQRALVWIRYRAGVDTTKAVRNGSTRYEIISVDNVEERSEYLELVVRVMRAG